MSSEKASQGEHYNLRWNNYFTNMIEVFNELRENELMVDVTLVCENQEIKAHKVILSACSGFFMNLFQTIKETQPIITFHEIEYKYLKHIISFLYQGEVKVLDVDLEGVLHLGERFQVKGLSSVKLKHKGLEIGDDSANKKDNTESVKYEMKLPLPLKYVPLYMPHTRSEDDKSPSGTEGPRKVRRKAENYNRTLLNSFEQPMKKFKIIPKSAIKSKMIRDRKSDNVEESNIEKNIKNGIKVKEYSRSILRTNSFKSGEIIDVDNTDESLILNDSTKLQKENTSTDLETKTSSPDSAKNKPKEMKKPINAFILFSKEWRKKLEVEHADEDYKSISVRLGNLWRTLTSETRESYYMAARQEQLNSQNKGSDSENGSTSF